MEDAEDGAQGGGGALGDALGAVARGVAAAPGAVARGVAAAPGALGRAAVEAPRALLDAGVAAGELLGQRAAMPAVRGTARAFNAVTSRMGINRLAKALGQRTGLVDGSLTGERSLQELAWEGAKRGSTVAAKAARALLAVLAPPEPGSPWDLLGGVVLSAVLVAVWAAFAQRTVARVEAAAKPPRVDPATGAATGAFTAEELAVEVALVPLAFVAAAAGAAGALGLMDLLLLAQLRGGLLRGTGVRPLEPRTASASIGARIAAGWLLDPRLYVTAGVAAVGSGGFAYVYLKVQELRGVDVAKWGHAVRVAQLFCLGLTLALMWGLKALAAWWRGQAGGCSAA